MASCSFKNLRLLFLVVLFSAISNAQPKGGRLFLNIVYNNEEVLFIKNTNDYNQSIKSIDHEFELIDNTFSNNGLKNLHYMAYPCKMMFWKDDYHLKIVHQKRDTMDVYVENIIEGHYYIRIPFKPHESYKLKYAPHTDKLINGKSPFLNIDRNYPKRSIGYNGFRTLVVDITPINWKKHLLTKKTKTKKDFIIRTGIYNDDIDISGLYQNMMPSCNTYIFSKKNDEVIVIMRNSKFPKEISENHYFQDCENIYNEFGYAEYRGYLVRTSVDSIYHLIIEKSILIGTYFQHILEEGNEDKMVIDDDADIIVINKNAKNIVETLICKDDNGNSFASKKMDTILKPNSIKLNSYGGSPLRFRDGFLRYDLPMCDCRFLEFNYSSPITQDPILLPYVPTNNYRVLKDYDASHVFIEIKTSNVKRKIELNGHILYIKH